MAWCRCGCPLVPVQFCCFHLASRCQVCGTIRIHYIRCLVDLNVPELPQALADWVDAVSCVQFMGCRSRLPTITIRDARADPPPLLLTRNGVIAKQFPDRIAPTDATLHDSFRIARNSLQMAQLRGNMRGLLRRVCGAAHNDRPWRRHSRGTVRSIFWRTVRSETSIAEVEADSDIEFSTHLALLGHSRMELPFENLHGNPDLQNGASRIDEWNRYLQDSPYTGDDVETGK